MPQVIPVVATAITTVTSAIAGAGMAAGLSAGLAKAGAVLLVKTAVSVAATAAVGLLSKPKVDKSGSPTSWQSDPNAPLPFLIGEMPTGGSIVYRKAFGSENMYQAIVAVISAAGPIQGVEQVLVERAPIAITGGFYGAGSQQAASPYGDKLWFRAQLGAQPTATALQSPSGLRGSATAPGWSSAHKLSGKAAYMATFGHDSKGKTWKRGDLPEFAVKAKGLKTWDPRLDSTYPGGSGASRRNVPSTWAYHGNPILHALRWAQGYWEGSNGGVPQTDRLVGGMGMLDDEIDIASFVYGASVSDLLGFTLAARPTTDDDKWQVLKAMMQAGGCSPATVDGRLTCIVRVASKTSLITLDRSDITGRLEAQRSPSRLERINTVLPRFRSPAHNWDMVTADAVTRASYVTEDGERRSRQFEYPYVVSATQASKLAAYDIADGREGFVGGSTFKPWMRDLKAGDCFTMPTDDDLGPLSGKKLMVLTRKFDGATGEVVIGFREETDSKHAWAGGVSGSVVAPVTPTGPPVQLSAPDVGDWALTAGAVGPAPALFLNGAVSNPLASHVILEYRVNGATDWTPWLESGVDGVHFETTDPLPQTAYQVAVSYRDGRTGEIGLRRVLGPVTTGGLTSNDIDNSRVPIGTNVIVNSAAESGGYGPALALGWAGTATGTHSGGVNAPGFFGQRGVFWAQVAGTPTAGQVFDVVGQTGYFSSPTPSYLSRYAQPLQPGDRIAGRARGAYSGGITSLSVVAFLYDAAGAYVSQVVLGSGGTSGGGSNGDPTTMAEFGGFYTIPNGSTARYAIIFVRANCSGGANPKAYATELFLAKVNTGQTALPPWVGSGTDVLATRGATTSVDLMRDNGTTVMTQAEVRTIEGTASAYVGQNLASTQNYPTRAGNTVAYNEFGAGKAYYDSTNSMLLSTTYTPSGGTPTGVAKDASTSTGGSNATTWVSQCSIAFNGLPAGGYFSVRANIASARVTSGVMAFNGNWRIRDSISNQVLFSGTFQIPSGGTVQLAVNFVDPAGAMKLRTASAGNTTLHLELQRSSGSNEIDTVTASIGAVFNASA